LPALLPDPNATGPLGTVTVLAPFATEAAHATMAGGEAQSMVHCGDSVTRLPVSFTFPVMTSKRNARCKWS
jgi:hypothetical protein